MCLLFHRHSRGAAPVQDGKQEGGQHVFHDFMHQLVLKLLHRPETTRTFRFPSRTAGLCSIFRSISGCLGNAFSLSSVGTMISMVTRWRGSGLLCVRLKMKVLDLFTSRNHWSHLRKSIMFLSNQMELFVVAASFPVYSFVIKADVSSVFVSEKFCRHVQDFSDRW